MFRGFKNSEYLKYTISSKIDKEFTQSRKDGSSNLIQIMSSIFTAAIASVLSTTLNTLICIKNPISKFFAILGVTLGIIIISYVLLYFLISLIHKEIRERRIIKLGYNETRELIEKFDNVACDSIIVVEKYLDDISKDTLSQEICDYSLYEIIHYIRKATRITEAILSQRNQCTSEKPNISKIDMFRVRNVVKILRIQIDKINAPTFNVSDKTAKEAIEIIEQNITELENKI